MRERKESSSELARIKARIKIRNAKERYVRCLFDKLFEYNMSVPLIIVSRNFFTLRGTYYHVKIYYKNKNIYIYIYIYAYIFVNIYFPFDAIFSQIPIVRASLATRDSDLIVNWSRIFRIEIKSIEKSIDTTT